MPTIGLLSGKRHTTETSGLHQTQTASACDTTDWIDRSCTVDSIRCRKIFLRKADWSDDTTCRETDFHSSAYARQSILPFFGEPIHDFLIAPSRRSLVDTGRLPIHSRSVSGVHPGGWNSAGTGGQRLRGAASVFDMQFRKWQLPVAAVWRVRIESVLGLFARGRH